MNSNLQAIIKDQQRQVAIKPKRPVGMIAAKPRYHAKITKLMSAILDWLVRAGLPQANARIETKECPDASVIGSFPVPWLMADFAANGVIFEPQGPRCGGKQGFGSVHVLLKSVADVSLAAASIRFVPAEPDHPDGDWLPMCSHRGAATLNSLGRYESEPYLLTEQTVDRLIGHVLSSGRIVPTVN